MEGVASQAQIYDAFSERGPRDLLPPPQERFARRRRRRALDGRHRGRGQRRRARPGTVERDIKAMRRNAMGDFSRYLNVYSLLTTGGVYHGQRAIPARAVTNA